MNDRFGRQIDKLLSFSQATMTTTTILKDRSAMLALKNITVGNIEDCSKFWKSGKIRNLDK